MHALENLPAEQQHIHAEATQCTSLSLYTSLREQRPEGELSKDLLVNHRFGISSVCGGHKMPAEQDLSTSAMLHADLKCGGVTEQTGAAVTVPPD